MRLLAALLITPLLFGEVFLVGTYTGKGSTGIYPYYFDAKTGAITSMGLPTNTPSPSFLAVHPSGKFLYAVNEEGKGSVSAFSIAQGSRALRPLNELPSEGRGPCHITVDHTGRVVIIANYDSGSVVSYLVASDGSLDHRVSLMQHQGAGPDLKRQTGPHAHSVYVSPDNKFVYVADLGLDRIYRYALDATTATLNATAPAYFSVKPGFGPRHIAFSKDQRFAYVINEMASKITVMRLSATGTLTEVSNVSTLPAEFKGESTTAEIELSPSGRFLYASNRGLDSIAVFAVSPEGGLKLLQNMPTGGATPRHFALTPDGGHLIAANQNGNNMSVFTVDQKTGLLTDTKKRTALSSPVCILFLK